MSAADDRYEDQRRHRERMIGERQRATALLVDLRAEITRQARAILRGETHTRATFSGPYDPRRMLRIELTNERQGDLIGGLLLYAPVKMPWEIEGPSTLDGVDVYVLDKLPAPGWRVINPLAKETDR